MNAVKLTFYVKTWNKVDLYDRFIEIRHGSDVDPLHFATEQSLIDKFVYDFLGEVILADLLNMRLLLDIPEDVWESYQRDGKIMQWPNPLKNRFLHLPT